MKFQGKHIVIVGPAYPLRGGLASYNERLARELMHNNRVTLLTFSMQYPKFLFPGESQLSADTKPEDLTIDVALNSIYPLNWICMGLKYKRLKPDVVIFRYWMPFFGPCFGTLARIIKGNKHTRIIAITDNIIPHEPRFFDKIFSRYFLSVLDGALAMSKKVLDDLHHFPLRKPVSKMVCHAHPLYDNFGSAVNRIEACSKLQLDATKRYVLFFGFIRQYKGLDLMLEAMALLPKSLDDLVLIVAGEFYEDSAPYLSIISEKKLQSRVALRTHFIPNSEVKLYFSVADLVAQPYRNATQSGVSQIAYHFELPMIITNVGGLSELVPHGEAGLVCEAHAEGLSSALIEIYKPGLLTHIRSQLVTLKKQFSWVSLGNALGSISDE
ncbi:MAG: glycosyl transferase family 1 [Flavobacteriales bacterium]|nr:MAG: glycosyl transferase family 1 [Flavobacteriales bacterium]